MPASYAYQKQIKAFHEEREHLAHQQVMHELGVRRPFETLLATVGRQHGWTFISEETFKGTTGKTIRPDAVFKDDFNLRRGYLESKDSNDNLDKEIEAKRARGYPFTNIIFEDSTRAVLFQNKQEVLQADFNNPTQLSDLLRQFFEYTEPDIEGFQQAVDAFKDRVKELGEGLQAKIEQAHKTNKAFSTAYATFHELCRESLNPAITKAQVDEMLIQHLLTDRLMRKVIDNPDFRSRNIIATEIDKVIDAMTSASFNRDAYLQSLDRFYAAIERAAHTLTDFSDKQHFLNQVYERFFQGYSVKTADTHGIVYTPQPIVDFMCASVEEVLRTEFGKKLGDDGVVILDPCTGTGNFIVNLINRAPPEALERMYTNGLYANEIMLLPYYVAALNIEYAYMQRAGSYHPFEGLCFVDTLDLKHGIQPELFGLTEENRKRVIRQSQAPITVIIGNPPYNVGQANENENNKNQQYSGKNGVDTRVKETYVKDSKATLRNKLYDPYVKFFRWASDRLQERDGIVCYVSNNSFVDQIAFDGMRKHLLQDFTRVYHIDLHGNVRQNPKLSGTTHNVFGIQVGVGITVAIRSKEHMKRTLHYFRVPEEWRKEEKLAWLSDLVRKKEESNAALLTLSVATELTPLPSPADSVVPDETRSGLTPPPSPADSAVPSETRSGLTPPPSPLPAGREGENTEYEQRRWMTGGDLWEKLKPLARQMRTNPTEAEDNLWQELRKKQQGHIKFRRQHSFERFIVDFYCASAKLIIEVDGKIHDYTQIEDQVRQAFLENQGLRVLRFTNEQVMKNRSWVLEQINLALSDSLTPPPATLPASDSEPDSFENIDPYPPALSPQAGKGSQATRVWKSLLASGEGFRVGSTSQMPPGGGVNSMIHWKTITPDARNSWIIADNSEQFSSFLPVGTKESKNTNSTNTIFKTYSLGISTNRDDVVYDFDASTLANRMEKFSDAYNTEVDRYKRKGAGANPDSFLDYSQIKWSRNLKAELKRGQYLDFAAEKVREATYRPFTKKNIYLADIAVDESGQAFKFFPIPETEDENRALCLTDLGSEKPFMVLMIKQVTDLHFVGAGAGTQCFPFYTYDEDGTNRRENITDWALAQFREHYADPTIDKWDIFYYVYGVLHSPDYRTKYGEALRKELPRIPFVPILTPPPDPLFAGEEGELLTPIPLPFPRTQGKGADAPVWKSLLAGREGFRVGSKDFRTFAEAGRKLADLHLNYETLEPYALEQRYDESKLPIAERERVIDKMALNKDKTAVAVNKALTLSGIPAAAFEYKLGNRSALEWVIDQYKVKDESDPNRADDPGYIVRLVGQVVRVSVETVAIVNGLPALE